MSINNALYVPPSFVAHYNANPPTVLYHYTGQAGLLGIAESRELWATKIQYMNDATEFDLALRMVRTELDAIIQSSKYPGDAPAAVKLRDSLRGIDEINICASCFCEDGDLLSQWRGYSAGKHGYAIGLDTRALAQTCDDADFMLGPCIYEPTIQRRIVQEAVAHCIENEHAFPLGQNWGYHGPLADILFRCGAFFKDRAFSDEKEWRLVSPTLMYNDPRLRFRPASSMVSPYCAFQIATNGRLPILQVIVGPCPHMQLAKSAVTSLLLRQGLLGPLSGQQIAFESRIPFRNW